MKPLFLPLRRVYYEAFADGSKRTEYRLAGPHWNPGTCPVGRPVVLSCGYGKQRRMTGTIRSFEVLPLLEIPAAVFLAVLDCYGDERLAGRSLAAIGIDLSD